MRRPSKHRSRHAGTTDIGSGRTLRRALLPLGLVVAASAALSGCSCGGPGTQACTPITCAEAGANCGEIDDGCGGTVQCGFCGGGMTCGGGGIPNVCGGGNCSPLSCAEVGAECGRLPDGCGGASECGVCTGGTLCGGSGRAFECGVSGTCRPTDCTQAGIDCGRIPDGCGGVVDCGAELGGCAEGEYCGGAGANLCGGADGTCVARSCSPADCGLVTDGCADVMDCGGCDPGLLCGSGSCVDGAGSVGQGCGSDSDCVTGLCLTGADGWTGGYCTAYCDTDADCGPGNLCAFTGGADPGVCVASCASVIDCSRTGYQCLSVPGDGRTACLPPDTPDPSCTPADCASLGAECGIATDGCGGTLDCGGGCDAGTFCGGGGPNQCGTGATGGSCTPRACSASDCGFVSDGCADVLDCGGCEGGQLCRPDGRCVGAADDVGDACLSNQDCATGVCLDAQATGWPGGYCTTWCTSDDDCGTGNACQELEATGRGVCLEICNTDNDCSRVGYTCADFDADGRRTCGPGGTGTGGIGDPCDTVADCAGGADAVCLKPAPGEQGTCTVHCGPGSPACAAGSHCAYSGAGNGVCALDCQGTADCPAGQTCADRDGDGRNECGPGGGTGEPCTADAECLGGTCVTQGADGWPGGYCTSGCTSDADCAEGSRCLPDATGEKRCALECDSFRDCRGEGYACQAPDGGQPVCLPYGSGTGEVGEPCSSTADCAGGADAVCVSDPGGGSYCSQSCQSAADCPPGAECVQDGGRNVCRQSCTSSADCLPNHKCENDTCVPDGSVTGGTGKTGDACTGSRQCEGAVCMLEVETSWRDGLCTAACQQDSDCTGDTHCSILETTQAEGQSYSVGLCYLDCTSDADCRQGYACWDSNGDGKKECAAFAAGSEPVGDACTTVDQCAGREQGRCMVTLDGYPEGYCTRDCKDTGCPAGSTCSKGKMCMDSVCCPAPDRAEGGCGAGTTSKPALLLHDDTEGGYCVATTRVSRRCNSTPDCGDKQVCLGGWCHQPATCSSGDWSWSGCPGGSLCHGGICVRPHACEDGCPSGSTCWGDYCIKSGYDCDPDTEDVGDCPSGTVCSSGGPGGTACIVVGNLGCSNANPCPYSRGWWFDTTSSVCFTDYCVHPSATCSKTQACPDGTICSNDTGGNCVACAGERCRDEYECGDLDGINGRECWPAAKGTGRPGDPCDSLDDCSGGILGRCIFEDVRLDEFRGGYCVWDCGGVSCPSGSTCIEVNPGSDAENSSKQCLKTCSSDAGCRPGYACYAVEEGRPKTCWPSNDEE